MQGVEYVPQDGSEYGSFIIEGQPVPYIKGKLIAEDKWALLLDDRFLINMDEQHVEDYLWWIANAIAVASGIPSHGWMAEER